MGYLLSGHYFATNHKSIYCSQERVSEEIGKIAFYQYTCPSSPSGGCMVPFQLFICTKVSTGLRLMEFFMVHFALVCVEFLFLFGDFVKYFCLYQLVGLSFHHKSRWTLPLGSSVHRRAGKISKLLGMVTHLVVE